MALDDTDADLRRRQAALHAAMSPAQRARIAWDLAALTDRLALAGLRARHPGASEHELRMRLLVRKHGAELVRAAYGWTDDG